MYRAVTHNIAVKVEPFYLDDRSDPAEGRYVLPTSLRSDGQVTVLVEDPGGSE